MTRPNVFIRLSTHISDCIYRVFFLTLTAAMLLCTFAIICLGRLKEMVKMCYFWSFEFFLLNRKFNFHQFFVVKFDRRLGPPAAKNYRQKKSCVSKTKTNVAR